MFLSGPNGQYSVIVDPKSLKTTKKKFKLKPMDSECDAIIYEASIRDMTSQTGIGVSHPKKILWALRKKMKSQKHTIQVLVI